MHTRDLVPTRGGHVFPLLALVAILLPLSAPARSARSAAPDDRPVPPQAAPTAGFRAEFLKELAYFERRFVSLAEAIPPEKYTWSPGAGVRSVSQVLLHVAQRGFVQPILIGTEPPADLRGRGYPFDLHETVDRSDPERYARSLVGENIVEANTRDKATVVAAVKASFAHIRAAVLRVRDEQGDQPVKWIGDNTYRGVMFFWLRHFGEHLGQLIAYARVNGIVPPWTQERQGRGR